MFQSPIHRTALLAGAALLVPLPALAQDRPAAGEAATAGTKRVYTPADFARFAPKTGFDLLVQVPGFTLRGTSDERGLGQASENVLINGQRVANKSGGAIAELQKVNAANVERIEIVEAASLGIAGLSGQVANVFLKAATASSGQFEWRPDFRAHYSKPNLFRGNASYAGKRGPVDYTLSVQNQAGRGAFGGPIVITDPAGAVIERRDEVLHNESDLVTFSTKLGIDGPASSVGNLLLSYTPYWAPGFTQYRRRRADGNDATRTTRTELNGWYYDINADFEFAVGPGRLKLNGLRHFDDEPVITTQITDFVSDAPDEGVRFSRKSKIAETVGRAEYGWKMAGNDVRLSIERAFNSLDQRGSLDVLDAAGDFQPTPFPEGTGKVQEVRYESIATLSRALGSKLDLQIDGGGEISKLERVDGDVPPRKFFRPKGSLTLGWRPSPGWDASLKLRRRVGQISFYDFLAQPNLQQERENSGNPDLVPPQSWEAETEVGRELGAWGKTRLRTYFHKIEDIIDVIPIGENGQGIGNLPSAIRFGAESKSTLQFEPIGWTGAKLDLTLGFQKTRVDDPLTGEERPISGNRDRWAELDLRHDIPRSQLAWGVSANYNHFQKYYYLNQVFRSWEGPWFVSAYAEHKDVFGLTVRAQVGNIFNGRHRHERAVYSGFRNVSPLIYRQSHNQLIGPIFSFLVKGNF